ncbi:L-serine dehydratase [Microlunatus phosphovorus NM-1]|uniref:L-serine dehydratase n=1 Tax=Microlunatus phosphovorus (strain ATCC 700054 / DSM 10555 / JCM 9379 / NBRC 101784 / NCIMB 13414 / VKM Ac-1990 / NM-1) TaxID=1032480 RepID=F5XDS1_MICPN|nr:L-serine ammonia-lyase [Microlunatus phosphovorus]BAK35094.1 L-serine dehydratase [Microlunatus phosphovorus NM-1]
MALSALDMFSVGIGPSSSHTVGPMRAAALFAEGLAHDGLLDQVQRVQAELFGSLGATGHGHGSDKAVILGLQGNRPETIDTDTADQRVVEASETGRLVLAGGHAVAFSRADDVIMHRRRSLPAHPNGMMFRAFSGDGDPLRESTYYSVGGGFVVDEHAVGVDKIVEDATPVRYPFNSGVELLEICHREGLRISDVMLANELSWRTEEQLRTELLHIWAVMKECVHNGCTRTDPVLPGGLRVPRRAPRLLRSLESAGDQTDPIRAMDWVNLFALAVNEENASGGRVVTAPTNGAAGIVPAVLHYYDMFVPGANEDGVVRFLLTAAAIGILFKENASISGAEVGCQGEVGSACAMAAGGLCEIFGGSPAQVENAAEIGIEHNLGLTCDPVGGLVQIPCIERNAIASNKAINAARIALYGDGSHKVSLDKAIKTMRETGADMKIKYKETSRGGLAVNVIEC